MGESYEEREVRRLLSEHDAEFVRTARHGDLYQLPSGERVAVGGTFSDHRSWKNTLAELRRKLGLTYKQEGDVQEATGQAAKVMAHGFMGSQLSELGIHEQKELQVLTVETRRYTIPLDVLLRVLPECVGAEVAVQDANGRSVDWPVTLTLKTETVENR